MAKWCQTHPIRVAAVSSLLIIVAVLALAWFQWGADEPDEFWSEVSKAGVQSIAAVVVGFFVSAALQAAAKQAADKQEELRQRREHRRGFILRLRSTYSNIVRARRQLEAAGFRNQQGSIPERSVVAYKEALTTLTEARLKIEVIMDELEAGSAMSPSGEAIRSLLNAIDRYLNVQVIEEYRQHAYAMLNDPSDLQFEQFPRTRVFVGDARASSDAFGPKLSAPFHAVTSVLERDILGLPPPAWIATPSD